MKKNYLKPFLRFLVPGVLAFSGFQLQAQTIFGVTVNNEMVSFNPSMPALEIPVPVTGLVRGQTMAGIDFRPNTGQLYLLGYNSTDSSANLYTVNKTTGAATKIGATALKLALGNGTKVGFDFNPTVDRIRIVAETGMNYRLHPVTGSVVATDGNLKFALSDLNAGKKPNASASAYTNSYIGAGLTVLYNYDDSLNIITSQIPPNDGILNTIGSTGIVSSVRPLFAGFDSYKEPQTLTEIPFLALTNATTTSIYTVDLATGAATLKGNLGTIRLKDVAVAIDRTLPEPEGQLIYALQGAANLISFDSENPETIRTTVVITGIATGQMIAGMDARPKTKELFILGYNSTSGESQLYILNPETGVATPVGRMPFTLALGNGPVGFDFNPVVDRIRVVAANNSNYRLNPITGAVAATDTALAYAIDDENSGKNPFISSIGYTNSFDGTTGTQLIGYDDSLNVFVLQNPPNRGTLNTIAASGLMVNPADFTTDIDVYYSNKDKTNTAFMIANTGARTIDSLYMVNLATGAAMGKGMIGLGVSVRDIAVAIDTTQVVTGIFETERTGSAGLKLYPNPVSDNTTLEFHLNQPSQVQVNVMNMLGDVISSGPSEQFSAGNQLYSFSTANLKEGIYLFELKVNGERKYMIKASK